MKVSKLNLFKTWNLSTNPKDTAWDVLPLECFWLNVRSFLRVSIELHQELPPSQTSSARKSYASFCCCSSEMKATVGYGGCGRGVAFTRRRMLEKGRRSCWGDTFLTSLFRKKKGRRGGCHFFALEAKCITQHIPTVQSGYELAAEYSIPKGRRRSRQVVSPHKVCRFMKV